MRTRVSSRTPYHTMYLWVSFEFTRCDFEQIDSMPRILEPLRQVVYPSENLLPGSIPNPIQFSLVRKSLSPHRLLRGYERRREVVIVGRDGGRFIVDHSAQRGLVKLLPEMGRSTARGAAIYGRSSASGWRELLLALDALHRLGALVLAAPISRLLACRATKLRRPPYRH
jgi:hypothetical protein